MVGISDVGHQAVDIGGAQALSCSSPWSASRSGLINLLPILPLDGGHIFWAWSRNCAAASRSRCG